MTPERAEGRRSFAGLAATEPIAITGLSCRFPGGTDPENYYRALIEGRDLFSDPPRSRWNWCADDQVATRKVGLIEDVLGFDNSLFRLSPREAETIDPHQRLMLEEAWLAIENAGYTPEAFSRLTTGVFVAVYNQDYSLYARSGEWDEISRMYLATGSAHSLVPNRISFTFDLRGPSEVVDTACSSALVAVHRAVEAIRAGECEQALVGGTSLLLEPSRLVMLAELGLLSPSGACAPFDRNSPGQVLGEGVAALILKPLAQALRDRDTVHALILGSGVNHQGASSGGLTRPSAAAQAELIRRTYGRNGINPGAVSYVEAHGNGGGGDLAELLAFQEVFPGNPAIGSVKGNIGFLEAAGGLSQIVKVVMAIRHGVMPGTRSHRDMLEHEELRPGGGHILSANAALNGLAGSGRPFVAGVHAYGLGGCNAHVVLTEPPEAAPSPNRIYPILLSGDRAEDLAGAASRLRSWLPDDVALADLAFTLAEGRRHGPCRVALWAGSMQQLAECLDAVRDGLDAGASSAAAAVSRPLLDATERWLAGETVDWAGLMPEGRRIALPGRPLRRRRFALPAIAGA